ncbi:hypothetical protein BZG36_02263 [Bifiguratus adelaidae]|uniref:DUF4460 domain-containing protein n=1 Tax=Bifiguratus adelaidae TaxID=1938954 RepID=A0A261XY63_9FUNG|nr:hypothetical protein BZG36_02263 [Bifiguratus adelaidae]
MRTLQRYVRLLTARVHPDLFYCHEDAKRVNGASLLAIKDYLRQPHVPHEGVQSLTFYVRTSGQASDGLQSVNVTLEPVPDAHSKHENAGKGATIWLKMQGLLKVCDAVGIEVAQEDLDAVRRHALDVESPRAVGSGKSRSLLEVFSEELRMYEKRAIKSARRSFPTHNPLLHIHPALSPDQRKQVEERLFAWSKEDGARSSRWQTKPIIVFPSRDDIRKEDDSASKSLLIPFDITKSEFEAYVRTKRD